MIFYRTGYRGSSRKPAIEYGKALILDTYLLVFIVFLFPGTKSATGDLLRTRQSWLPAYRTGMSWQYFLRAVITAIPVIVADLWIGDQKLRHLQWYG